MGLLNIIVVNWNAGETLYKCLQLVFSSTLEKSRYHVFVVDNNSSDNSIDLISGLSSNLTVISNKLNVGFGRACNIVLENYPSEFVLLLNPDVFLRKESLYESLVFMENNTDIDALGVKNYDINGKVATSCARFPSTCRLVNDILGLSKIAPKLFKPGTIMTDWDHLDSRDVDHVIGAYMMARYSILKEVEFFDKDYFLYLEDLDLTKKIKKAGGRIYYNSEISIIHEGGGTTKRIRAISLYYSLQSRIIYSRKHFKPLSTALFILLSTTFEPLIRIIKMCITFDFRDFYNICRAYGKYYKWLIFGK